MLDRLDDEACPWQGYKALCVGVIWWLGLALFPFHLLLVFSSRDAGYGGHRVQRVWSIRGRYGLYGPLHTLHPRCVHGIVKRLYGAAAGMRTLGEWALYCDWTGHSVALLSLIPVTALIPRYPSLSPRHTRPVYSFFPQFSSRPQIFGSFRGSDTTSSLLIFSPPGSVRGSWGSRSPSAPPWSTSASGSLCCALPPAHKVKSCISNSQIKMELIVVKVATMMVTLRSLETARDCPETPCFLLWLAAPTPVVSCNQPRDHRDQCHQDYHRHQDYHLQSSWHDSSVTHHSVIGQFCKLRSFMAWHKFGNNWPHHVMIIESLLITGLHSGDLLRRGFFNVGSHSGCFVARGRVTVIWDLKDTHTQTHTQTQTQAHHSQGQAHTRGIICWSSNISAPIYIYELSRPSFSGNFW